MKINSKSSVKFIVAMLLLVSVATVAPTMIYAAWWNPLSWFNKEKPADEQKPNMGEVKDTNQESQPTDTTKTEKDTANIVVPPSNSRDAKTIEGLRAEIATLKASLDSLYTAHNNLVKDHNTLLEYTKSIAAIKPSSGGSNGDLEKKVLSLNLTVEELGNKLTRVCRQIFSSSIGTPSQICPTSLPIGASTLENRIKKLEGGY